MSVYTKTSLGFTVGSTALPDPSSYSYTVADLDISGERDTTGLLHREKVAMKHNASLKWNALDWKTIQSIISLVTAESFSFTFPCPETGGTYTGTYYVGDRSVDNFTMSATKYDSVTQTTVPDWENFVAELSINFIEF